MGSLSEWLGKKKYMIDKDNETIPLLVNSFPFCYPAFLVAAIFSHPIQTHIFMKKISILYLFVTFCITYVSAQTTTGTVNGTVTTSDNKPAEGVTVLVKDLNRTVMA